MQKTFPINSKRFLDVLELFDNSNQYSNPIIFQNPAPLKYATHFTGQGPSGERSQDRKSGDRNTDRKIQPNSQIDIHMPINLCVCIKNPSEHLNYLMKKLNYFLLGHLINKNNII